MSSTFSDFAVASRGPSRSIDFKVTPCSERASSSGLFRDAARANAKTSWTDVKRQTPNQNSRGQRTHEFLWRGEKSICDGLASLAGRADDADL